ncbi:type VII secretion integral membrane protein EccD [Streptomyces sp. 4N509B]|uniref:type VII secretion integral membrane protein EccD n=1 Tax=Streptomyces sp. 4N509B TaxID=3457413 RepID=UPI003FD3F1C0
MSAILTHQATASPSPSPTPSPTPDPASRPAPAPTGAAAAFVRVGVAGPRGRVDLAVPAAVPLATLLPTLLRQAGEDPGPDGGTRHGAWVLRRADGIRLEAAGSLADQGVAEGDLLFLGHGSDDATPPVYDDVVEVIAEHGVRHAWSATATRYGAAALATIALLAGTATLALAPGTLPGWLGLATAVLVLWAGVLMARGFGDAHAGTFAGALAALPASVGVVRLLGVEGDGPGAAHLLLVCAVVAVIGGLGPVLVGGGDGVFAALVVAAVLGAVGALLCTVWRDVSPTEAASVAAPLALALTTLWPTLALRLARLPAPQVAATSEDLERLPSQLAHERLTARVAAARRLLGGLLLGSHAVAAVATVLLLASTELWASTLAGVLTLLTLLRARLFRETTQTVTAVVTALVAAGGAAVVTVLDRASQAVPLLGLTLPVTLTVALVAGTVAVAARRHRLNPRLARAMDVLETTLLLAVVPLVLAVWEVYGALLNLRA